METPSSSALVQVTDSPVAPKSGKSKAPEQTFEETRYLRRLVEERTPVRVRLSDNSEFDGTVEFYDANFIRITRPDGPNLFLFKHDIKYIYELP